jgi:chromosome segregation ATPase
MTQNDNQMSRFERRLDSTSEDIRELKADVTVLKADVSVLKADVSVLKADVNILKADVSVLKADVSVLKADVSVLKSDVSVLKDDVRGLRVLYEHHDEQIRMVAEVQAHHGRQLEEHGRLLLEIRQELVPMRALYDFVRRIAEEHDRRLSALEKHTGIQ